MIYALDGTNPSIAATAWVAPDANVIGNVELQAESSVWFGCTLRGDNEPITIGENSNIQDGTIMHTDPGMPLTIGAGCTIGHQAILHGCTIGENTLIGMGATILNGAVIGPNCLVGANALVTEGKEFPEGSLIVGSPAKAVRDLNAGAIQGLKASALHYRANMQRFKAGLTAV